MLESQSFYRFNIPSFITQLLPILQRHGITLFMSLKENVVFDKRFFVSNYIHVAPSFVHL